ncbi:hypothetical protein A3A95_04500 [Candidatus Nomurabacteria bacterium RIFCSPLOWO2_01_FULL_39_18]|uniref:CDP-diacylglycerol--glycerol-3-phosphate 3-phosphatidyltransferase n=1 Tax=Candidatus Nomurabacteria bacterium RIFCSPHIGHO2_01_FULL_40_24b TaxID=1801739 RepID=A0A1F6V5V3_9BACT|nr:MAG: hypothetical protein A2647_04025 [Candidatus Nomurabacteria bacterium RIFCSPHIGHO2_01_FULL_40_24b]OGI89357.1 MAG: hypothetical protein A3A95_04500 [Candidatus Nomurabacteria bacterium RIFCSPLOWO2_01_FULL_39_18]
MKQIFEKFVLFLHSRYGITPNILTYIRIFAAPWLALFVSKSISGKFGTFVAFTLVFYILVISTDFFDGLLARQIYKRPSDHAFGGMLDRLSDKMLIIFLLIPFGLNLLTVSIVLGESILAYGAIKAPDHKKQATRIGKLKMLFQALLIPVLIISRTTSLIPDVILYFMIIATMVLTYASIYSHHFKNS